MVRDIHDYDSLKKAYDVLLMFERFPGPVRSERVEEFVTQLKRDIREYVNRVSDCRKRERSRMVLYAPGLPRRPL